MEATTPDGPWPFHEVLKLNHSVALKVFYFVNHLMYKVCEAHTVIHMNKLVYIRRCKPPYQASSPCSRPPSDTDMPRGRNFAH